MWILLQWIPPPQPIREQEASEQIAIDLGDEYEQALTDATQEEIIDLAGKQLTVNKVTVSKCLFC